MGRLTTYLLVLVLGAGAAFALVSCGDGGGADLLPGNTSQQISENLDTVKQLASSGECVGAEDAAQEVSQQISALGGVDKELKQALRDGATRLNEVVVAECSPATTESIAPASIPEPTEDTATEPAREKKSPKKSPTVETNTQPTTPTTTSTPTTPTTTPTTTTTPTVPPPTEGGGTGVPPGGVSPGGTTEGG